MVAHSIARRVSLTVPKLAQFLLIGIVLSVSATSFAKTPADATVSQAVVDGFRSARFGMDKNDVLRAIFKDFKIPKSKVTEITHPTEKTTSFGVEVDNLLPKTGKAQVFYILGYKTQKLFQINVLWGKPVEENPDASGIVDAANQLRTHFLGQGYEKEGLVLNLPLKEDNSLIMVFQGKDKQGRTTRLVLNDPQEKNGKPHQNITLTLSYIENPSFPDIFKIKEGDF